VARRAPRAEREKMASNDNQRKQRKEQQ